VSVSLDDGSRLAADELLVAIGRTPRTAELGLETIGLKPGQRIEVDDQCAAPSATGCSRSATPTGAAC
jgi:dihydrolipoamide dehydrogenase